MLVSDAEEGFSAFAHGCGVVIADLFAIEAVDLLVEWYRRNRVADVNVELDGDMLLFQWGTYDWGDGASFEYGITRQLISVDADDDDDIWQLSLTAHYSPTHETRTLDSGSRWCSAPSEVHRLRQYIQTCPATAFVAGRKPSRLELAYACVG